MAKKPKKAPPAEGEAAEAPKSKKKRVLAVAGVLVLAGAGGGYVLLKKKPDPDPAQTAQVKKPAAFLDVRDMVVNLSPEPGQSKGTFLKLKVALELKDASVESEVKPLLPRVEDTLQVYMRELRASDLAGSAGLYRLREELLRRVNIAIHPARAEAVLFKDVNVQ